MTSIVKWASLPLAFFLLCACKKDHTTHPTAHVHGGFVYLVIDDSISQNFQTPGDLVLSGDTLFQMDHEFFVKASRKDHLTADEVAVAITGLPDGPLQAGVYNGWLYVTREPVFGNYAPSYSGDGRVVISRVAGDTVEGYCQQILTGMGQDSIKAFMGFVRY